MSKIIKNTTGYVKQVFDEKGICLSQIFVTGDEVTYIDSEERDISTLPIIDELYYPFDMVQPK